MSCLSARTCVPASTSGRCSESAVCFILRRPSAPHQQQRRAASGCQQLQRRGQRAARAAAAAGGEKPEWFRELEATADMDESAARLLAGANGDPNIVQQRIREEQDALHSRIMGSKYGGEDAPMDVSFRSPADNFSLWVWLELYRPPTGGDLEMLQEVVNSWFLLGRLGGFNSSNLQVLYHQDEALEDLEYDQEDPGAQMAATFHDMGQLEAQGSWCRFWIDMGTADELALDVLINALSTLSREQLGVRQLVLGGQNQDWATPQREDYLPEVTMDPMRGPVRYGDGEDEDEDEEDEYLP